MTNQSNGNIAKFPSPQERAIKERGVTLKYRNTIATLHEILENEMHDLKKIQATRNDHKEDPSIWQEEWNKKFGAKETVVSVAIKMLNTLNKLIAMDNKAVAAVDVFEAANSNVINAS